LSKFERKRRLFNGHATICVLKQTARELVGTTPFFDQS
jgi:hypothetical protein